MASIFITGSSDGLGRAAAALLVAQGHRVTLHARDASRAQEAMAAVPGAAAVLHADFAKLTEVEDLAARANAVGQFDAVIHNAAVGFREKRRLTTVDGFAHVFAINTLAPFVLTALMARPRRLIYVSSELHHRGTASIDDLNWTRRTWQGNQAYSDTKLHDAILAFALARRWPASYVNALEPGWVGTKMGGAHATGDLEQAHLTQVWLATGGDTAANVTGGYFFHCRHKAASRAARDTERQDELISELERLSGVKMPLA